MAYPATTAWEDVFGDRAPGPYPVCLLSSPPVNFTPEFFHARCAERVEDVSHKKMSTEQPVVIQHSIIIMSIISIISTSVLVALSLSLSLSLVLVVVVVVVVLCGNSWTCQILHCALLALLSTRGNKSHTSLEHFIMIVNTNNSDNHNDDANNNRSNNDTNTTSNTINNYPESLNDVS